MRITGIKAKNFKGSPFFGTVLGPITLIHGPNFGGKTSRLEALALALTRQVPGVASRPSDVFAKYASGTSMEVSASLSDDTECTVRMEKGRKSVEATYSHAEPLVPASLFNLSEFLDLSGPERVKFLFNVLPPPELAKVRTGVMARIKSIKCDPHTEAHEEAVDRYCQTVDGLPASGSSQEWLESVVEEVASQAKEDKASAKMLRQTVAGATALRTGGGNLAAIECEMVVVRALVDSAVACHAQSKQKLEQARAEFMRLRSVAAGAVDETKIRNDVARLEQEAAALESHPEPAPFVEAAPEAPKEMRDEVGAQMLEEDRSKVASFATVHAQRQCLLDQAKRLVDELEKPGCVCGTCGQSMAAVQAAKLPEARRELVAAQRFVKYAKEELESAKQEQEKAAARASVFEATRKAARGEYESKLAAYLHRRTDAEKLAKDHRNRLTSASIIRRDVAVMKEKLAKNSEAKGAAAKLVEIEGTGKEAATLVKLDEDALAAAQQRMRTAQEVHKEALASVAQARTVSQAGEKADRMDAFAQVGAEVKDLLSELLKECIAQSVTPLVVTCNSLCSGILPGELVFEEGELRMRNKYGVHSHETFSGTEKALAYAALAVALATKSPLKLVVIDEVGRLDEGNKRRLASRLVELVDAGTIDQAIIVDTADWPLVAGLTQVRIGGAK